ncbi:(2Fe-2S) ferredoxin domain-containing protein [Brevibacillus dissolubilis]|uniref:(2Fe-2S) ferredoxin domain-containing protein n=1 Tax=Brevibacillus dissolubilis TaxID=1844116 RepID=UPI0011179AFE|nr:(2Fe-2S) ferredoxin domain-containing protein [Brevibacillus dissolubilis]
MPIKNLTTVTRHLILCNGGTCSKKGAEAVTQAIRDEIARVGADDFIHSTKTLCNGRCVDSCVVAVYPEGIWYRDVRVEDAPKIVRQHLLAGEPVEELVSFHYDGNTFQTSEQKKTNESPKR